jgi:peroxiredoxin
MHNLSKTTQGSDRSAFAGWLRLKKGWAAMLSVTILMALWGMLCPITVTAGDGYRIGVTVRGLAWETCYLAYHYGDRQFLKDTAVADIRGHFIFEGTQRLDPGMYMVVLPGQQYFEILVDGNQQFAMETSLENMIVEMRFTGSPENEAFYEYLRFLNLQRPEMNRLREVLNNPETPPDRREMARQGLDSLNAGVRERQDLYMDAFPDGLFTAILLSQRDPEIPESYHAEGKTADQVFMRNFFIANYWVHMDFSDDRMLRTPVYHSLLRRYFGDFLHQVPDTIIRHADRVIDKSRAHPEVFRYTVWFLTNYTERSQIMGMDAAYVHMLERYYGSGEAFWMEEDPLRRLMERVNNIKPLLIGQTAPDITLFTRNGEPRSLHDVEARYLVVYFWESDCVHCQRETPALKELYEKYRDKGLEVFAANTEGNPENWKNAVGRYGLEWINVNDTSNRSGFREKYDIYAIPMIYLLDENKRIIAKKLSVEQLEGFLEF